MQFSNIIILNNHHITHRFLVLKPNSKKASTSNLLQKLIKTDNLGEFLHDYADEFSIPPFHEYITKTCLEKQLIPEQVINKSAIERTYGHQLFNGTRKPSRDKALQLAFGMELNLEETEYLLIVAKKSQLYPKIKRDAAIIYCLNNRLDIYETQSLLESLGISILGEAS